VAKPTNPPQPVEVARLIRRLLDEVEAGRMTASAGLVARLEGAALALDEVQRSLGPDDGAH
jgi:hypothetical protein